MESIECKNCGSPALELVGNEYVCRACGSKFQASDLFSTPQSESTTQLTEEQKAELKRLKANLKDDHSLKKRILELDPCDWEAYCYTYDLDYTERFDEWLVCLQRSGLSVKEIENILNTYYYEEKKKRTIEEHLSHLEYAVRSGKPQHSDFKYALTQLLDFKKKFHSKGLHIKSILGDEYSGLVQKWESDWDDTTRRYTKELQNKRNEVGDKRKKKKNLGIGLIIIGVITMIGGVVCVHLEYEGTGFVSIFGGLIIFLAGGPFLES